VVVFNLESRPKQKMLERLSRISPDMEWENSWIYQMGWSCQNVSSRIACHKAEKCAATIFLFGNLQWEPCHLHAIFFLDYYGCPLEVRSLKKSEPNCVKTVTKTLHNWRRI
jgi:hypothetical protein